MQSIYLGNKEIYNIFKICCIFCISFSTNYHLLHYFINFHSNNTNFFINHAQKFKYQPGHLRITTDISKHKWFQYFIVHLMQDMQYSTFIAECILISALLLPVEGNSTTLYQSTKWTFVAFSLTTYRTRQSSRERREFIIQNALMHKILMKILHNLS